MATRIEENINGDYQMVEALPSPYKRKTATRKARSTMLPEAVIAQLVAELTPVRDDIFDKWAAAEIGTPERAMLAKRLADMQHTLRVLDWVLGKRNTIGM